MHQICVAKAPPRTKTEINKYNNFSNLRISRPAISPGDVMRSNTAATATQ
jgi:hypothetical protein